MFGKKDKIEVEADVELFVIYDSKVGAYERPNFAVNRHDLIRQLLNMFRDPAQAQNKYLLNAEDYSIFKVGELHYKSGSLIAHTPEHIANLHDLRTAALQSRTQSEQHMGIVPT